MAKPTLPTHAVTCRVLGRAAMGPWFLHDGDVARVDEGFFERIDVATGETRRVFAQERGRVCVATRAPRLVRQDRGGEAIVADLEGNALTTLRAPTGTAWVKAISNDGAWVIGSDYERWLLWDASTGACIHDQELGEFHLVTFAPDDRSVLLERPSERTWLVARGDFTHREIVVPKSRGHYEPGVFSPSGRKIAFVRGRMTVVVDTATGDVGSSTKETKTLGAVVWLDESTLAFASGTNVIVRRSGGAENVFPVRGSELAIDHERGRLACAIRPTPYTPPEAPALVVLDRAALLAAPLPDVTASRPSTTKPKVTTPRGCFFGVSRDVSVERILESAKNLYDVLDRQPDDFAVRMTADEDIAELRFVQLVGPRGCRFLLEPFIESLSIDLGPLTVIVRASPASRFERDGLVLVSEGKKLSAWKGALPAGVTKGDAIDVGLAALHPGESTASLGRLGGGFFVSEGGAKRSRAASREELEKLFGVIDLDVAVTRRAR